MQASSYQPDNGSDAIACAGTPRGRPWRETACASPTAAMWCCSSGNQWIDGTTHVVFDPVELLGRLAVLVPRPRINLMLYHGVLAPRAAWRPGVVRRQTSGDGRDPGLTESATEPARETDTADAARRHARGQCWASLMARTCGIDVLACPGCGGRLRPIVLIEEAAVIDRILRHLGLPTETPAPRPARAPPFLTGVPDAAGWDDDASVFDACS